MRSVKITGFVLLFIVVTACQNKYKPQPVENSKQSDSIVHQRLNTLLHLKNILDRARPPIKTDTVNVCYSDETDSEKFSAILDLSKNDSGHYKERQRIGSSQKRKPCLGSSIDVYPHNQVTRLQFSAESTVLIVGHSMHDSAGSIDATVVKFGPNDYGFTLNHICGAIQIGYVKNRMNPHDILLDRGEDDSWHSFADESQLRLQILENLGYP